MKLKQGKKPMLRRNSNCLEFVESVVRDEERVQDLII